MNRLSYVWSEGWEDSVPDRVCALANTEGGILEISGFPADANQLLADSLSFAGEGVRTAVSDGKATVTVSPSPYPIRFRGRYMSIFGGRVFDATQQIEKELRKRAEKVYWLDRPYPDVHIDDLDWHAMEDFRIMARDNGDGVYFDMSDAEMLDSMNLLDDGVPTGTAVLLFHPRPEEVLTNSYTRLS